MAAANAPPGALAAAAALTAPLTSDDAVVRHILRSVANKVPTLRRARAEREAADRARMFAAQQSKGSSDTTSTATATVSGGSKSPMVIPSSAFAPSLPNGGGGGGNPGGPTSGIASALLMGGIGGAPSAAATNANLAVTDTLAAFVVRAVVLNPANGFHLDAVFARADVDRLIDVAAALVAADGHAEGETVKMQVYFDSTFPQQAEYLHREKQARRNTAAPILRDITEWSAAAAKGPGGMISAVTLDALYRKMVGYVLLKTAMGNPTDTQVAREASVALESVFPQSEVATFLGLARPDKERQLNGLAQLVAGIRLFNRHVNKASKDKIENIPELCSREIKEAFMIIQDKTKDAERKIKLLTAILTNPFLDSNLVTMPMSAALTVYLTNALTFYRQLLIYLDAVREQIEASSAALKQLDDRMAACLADLAHACRARSAVPVDQVYPKFMELAVVWQGFQDELFLDAFRRGVLDTVLGFEASVGGAGLSGGGTSGIGASAAAVAAGGGLRVGVDGWQAMLRSAGPAPEQAAAAVSATGGPPPDALTADLQVLMQLSPESVRSAALSVPIEPPMAADDAIIAKAAVLQSDLATAARRHAAAGAGSTDAKGHIVSHAHHDLEVLHPGNTAQYYKLPVELGGFCPVTLVSAPSRGTAVPGDWSQGVVKYRDKLYAFRSGDEARRFASAPDQ
ncbi:hypothetical protein BC828DRAFT_393380, partial [Blastocladiella britannica]